MWTNPPICTPTVHPFSEENGILDVDLSSEFWSIVELQLLIPFSEEHGNPDVDLSSEFWSIVGHFLPNICITMLTHWFAVSRNQIFSGKRALNIVTPALIPHLTLERPYMSICCSSSQEVSSSNALWLNNCVPQN
jgi:hypothetical protein